MAYAHRRRKSKLWTVYYYDKAAAKLIPLARKDTPAELQLCETKEEAQSWVDAWAERNGIKVHRALRFRLRATDELKVFWDEFQSHWKTWREIEENTMEDRNATFERHVLPYFVGKLGLKNVRLWHKQMIDFTTWISQETKVKDPTSKKKILWMMRRFGEYLVAKGVLEYPWVVFIPTKNERRKTPLTQGITPEEALQVSRSFLPASPEFALAILAGYFACLGPAEVYGLERRDFITGTKATLLAKTYDGLKQHESVFKEHPLGSRLSISIERQVVKSKIAKFPKNDYRREIVNIWYQPAAVLIGSILSGLPDGRLFSHSRSHHDKLHRDNIKKKINDATGHDLRRASALYLGRHVRLPLELLQRHMRHSQLSTTELYIREPNGADTRLPEDQDFGDVEEPEDVEDVG